MTAPHRHPGWLFVRFVGRPSARWTAASRGRVLTAALVAVLVSGSQTGPPPAGAGEGGPGGAGRAGTTVASGSESASESGSAPAPAAVSVDLSRSLGRFPFEPGRQLSAIPKQWRFGPGTYSRLEALDLARVRVWVKFSDAYDVPTRTPEYANLYGYLETYHSRARILVVNWQTEYDPLVTEGVMSAAELVAAQQDMLAHYKLRFPRITHVEVENEPDIRDYYPKYATGYRIVNGVNALRLPGEPLKVGGPALDTFSVTRLGQFLDAYAADRAPAKRLDFVSYHQYLINTRDEWHVDKDHPALVAGERSRVDTMMGARGLPPVPVLVTEIGVFPKDRESHPRLGPETDLHIQAAGLASLEFHYAGQRDIVPFHWTVDHPLYDRKDLFADTASGESHPYYNALLMASMLPQTRYAATTDALKPRGVGVYAVAAADADTVAVMTWNYQWTGTSSFAPAIRIAQLPESLRGSNVLIRSYTIPADRPRGDLVQESSRVVLPLAGGSYAGPAQELRPNEFRLLLLTPTDASPGPRPES